VYIDPSVDPSKRYGDDQIGRATMGLGDDVGEIFKTRGEASARVREKRWLRSRPEFAGPRAGKTAATLISRVGLSAEAAEARTLFDCHIWPECTRKLASSFPS
jgi:hypothetical protein